MKCKHCDGVGFFENGASQFKCVYCDGSGEFDPNEVDRFNAVDFIKVMEMVKKPQTNDEWRRTCSTEEFAEFLFIIGEDNWLTDISNRDEIVPHEKDVVEWLKQPHTTEER